MKASTSPYIVFSLVLVLLFGSGCKSESNNDELETLLLLQASLQQNTSHTYFMDSFDTLDEERWEASDGSNGGTFYCVWTPEQVTLSQAGRLQLSIDPYSGSPPYKSGEYRSLESFHYGLYEVKMKPASGSGIISSFFTYTGPSDNTIHDEIDIEFPGRDTTKVEFNYYSNGAGNHEYSYDLGFDATAEFHTYGFLWQPDFIRWYVDGVAVHEATEAIPVTPSKIMINLWPGTGVDDWLGPFDGSGELTAEYDFIRYSN